KDGRWQARSIAESLPACRLRRRHARRARPTGFPPPRQAADGPRFGSGAAASWGLFAVVPGSSASTPLVDGPTFGSGAAASWGLLAVVPGISASTPLVDGAMFGSGAIAPWA